MWRTLGPVWEENEDVDEIKGIAEIGEMEEIKETNGMDEEMCNEEAYGDADGDGFDAQNISIKVWQLEVERFQAQEQEREYGHPSSSPSCFI